MDNQPGNLSVHTTYPCSNLLGSINLCMCTCTCMYMGNALTLKTAFPDVNRDVTKQPPFPKKRVCEWNKMVGSVEMQHRFNIEFNNTHLQVIMNQEPKKDELLRLRDEKRGKTTRKLRFLLNVSSVSQSSSKTQNKTIWMCTLFHILNVRKFS